MEVLEELDGDHTCRSDLDGGTSSSVEVEIGRGDGRFKMGLQVGVFEIDGNRLPRKIMYVRQHVISIVR